MNILFLRLDLSIAANAGEIAKKTSIVIFLFFMNNIIIFFSMTFSKIDFDYIQGMMDLI